MVVMGHRRINMLGEVEDEEEPETQDQQPVGANRKKGPCLLIAETENEPKEEFQHTDEMKALTQEVIKTIKEIIVSVTTPCSQFRDIAGN